MSGLVPSRGLAGCATLIEELGGSPDALTRAAGLPPRALLDHDLPLKAEAATQLLEIAARELNAPDFGLRLARRQGLQILGPLWILASSAPTVREALADLVNNFALYASAMTVSLAEEGGAWALRYELRVSEGLPITQAAELGLALVCQELRGILGPAWRPLAVQFRHAAPADTRSHRAVFGPAFAFSQDRDAVVLDGATANAPMRVGGERVRGFIQRGVRHNRAYERPREATRAELAVRALIPFGRCDLAAVARELGLAPRTLQARLTREGETFQGVLDQVRLELSIRYLLSSDLRAGEIAELLGFADSSAFTRFMKLKTTKTPKAWRADGSRS